MFDTPSLVLFISATLALLIVPGPAVLFIVARSLEQGRMAGFVSTLGIQLGAVVHVLFAALGLSTILMQSALAFSVIKFLGAAYLIYLGVKTLLSKPAVASVEQVEKQKLGRIFYQGFIVNLLNPKTAIFFFAFLPQFINPTRGSTVAQIVVLGVIFITLALLSDSAYAFLAGTLRNKISGSLRMAKLQKNLSGGIYILLGVTTALSGNRS